MNRIWNLILKIWKDPVWSKVIAAGFILFISTIWLKYFDYSLDQIIGGLKYLLTFNAPLYVIVVFVVITFCFSGIFKRIRKKTNPIWGERIGNYSFDELYKILQRQTLEVRTPSMSFSGRPAPKQNLLDQFAAHIIFFNKGVTAQQDIGDGGYTWGVLGPKYVSYGLVDRVEKPNDKLQDVVDVWYFTSELGHKFYSLLEKRKFIQQPEEAEEAKSSAKSK